MGKEVEGRKKGVSEKGSQRLLYYCLRPVDHFFLSPPDVRAGYYSITPSARDIMSEILVEVESRVLMHASCENVGVIDC